mgnify:CR=1 FL=1
MTKLSLACTVVALTLSGCATTISVIGKTDKAMPYAGVRFDGHIVANPQELYARHPALLWVGWPLALIDLPLSAVADTVVLPYMLQGKTSAIP